MKGRYFSAIIRPSKFREDGRIFGGIRRKEKEETDYCPFNPIGNPFSNSCNNNYLFCTNQSTNGSSQKEATAIAKTSANLETVDKFYWFTRKNTYFTLTGKNDKGTEIVVIVPKSGEKVTVLNQKDGQTEQQITDIVAKAHPDESVMKATLGLYDKRPAWEVVTENDQGVLTYYLMSFDKGEEINVVKDI